LLASQGNSAPAYPFKQSNIGDTIMTIKFTEDHMIQTISSSGAFFMQSDTTDPEVVDMQNKQIARCATQAVTKKWQATKKDGEAKLANKKLVERLILAQIPADNFRASGNKDAYEAGKQWLYGALPEDVRACFDIDESERDKDQAKLVRRATQSIGSMLSSIARSLDRAYDREALKKAKEEGKKPVATASAKTAILNSLTTTRKKFEQQAFDFNVVKATKQLDELLKTINTPV
jgi:hypothetical protein